MPVFQHPDATNIEQETCRDCKAKSINQPEDEAVECDVCRNWICFPCSGVSREVYKFATEKETTIDYICKPCKVELPQIREIVSIKQTQNKLIEKVDREEEINRNFREQQDGANHSFDVRLKALEKIVDEKNLADAEFPPLPQFTEQAQNLQKVMMQQQTLDRKVKEQESTFTEQKQIAEKESSLIVYGIPETIDDETEQMKEDFAAVKYIYNTKATLGSRDLTQIIRLGKKSKADEENKIRPIKITFANQAKKQEILRNNKNLILEGTEFPACTSDFCDEQGRKHKHIYVSPDKTRKQRDEEKELRKLLKQRKTTEPDLIIRNGKIIKKPTRARWSDVSNNES